MFGKAASRHRAHVAKAENADLHEGLEAKNAVFKTQGLWPRLCSLRQGACSILRNEGEQFATRSPPSVIAASSTWTHRTTPLRSARNSPAPWLSITVPGANCHVTETGM